MGPKATPSGGCPEFDANFFTLAGEAGLCAVWKDTYDGEDGYRIKVFYFEAEVTDTFDFPPNSVEMVLSDVLRGFETFEECRLYRTYSVQLFVVIDGEEQMVGGIATSLEGCPGLDDGME